MRARDASPITGASDTGDTVAAAWCPRDDRLEEHRHERIASSAVAAPLRQGHRSLQARALGDRARRHPRPPLRLRQAPSCPPASRWSTSSTFLTPAQRRAAEPGAGPHLRQHVRPGRALHRRQDARGQPRARARRPGRVRGAGPLHRRGAQAPGAVPPHRRDARRQHAARLRLRGRAERGRRARCSARAPGRCWR